MMTIASGVFMATDLADSGIRTAVSVLCSINQLFKYMVMGL
jgi:hypothetical protein